MVLPSNEAVVGPLTEAAVCPTPAASPPPYHSSTLPPVGLMSYENTAFLAKTSGCSLADCIAIVPD